MNNTVNNLDEAVEVLTEYSKLHAHNGNQAAAQQMRDIILLIKDAREDLEKSEGQLQDAQEAIDTAMENLGTLATDASLARDEIKRMAARQ